MFKTKKISLIMVSLLVLTLGLGLVAFTPIDTTSAADPVGQEGPGGPDGSRGGRDHRSGQREAGLGGENTFLADALGITAEELQTAMAEARSTFETRPDKDDMNAALANALGITAEELDVAREAAKDAATEQALADGKITEEQVAMMEAREALKNYIEKDELLAKALGITVEELETAQENGQRIPDLLDELGIDQETFQADMQTAHEDALQQAVEDGVITQEQADQISDNGFGGAKGSRGRGPSGRGDRGNRGSQGFQGVQIPTEPGNDG